MKLEDKIYIAGHTGLVGSAFVRNLENRGYSNLLLRMHKDLDLTNQLEVQNFFKQEKPDYVILAAAKVGGIYANNSYPADFIYQNMMIEANVINSAYMFNTKRLLFLGSTCIYPKEAHQPMREDSLLTGVLEPTNEPYALSKIVGIKVCESYNRQYGTDFRSVMPTNLYGMNDNFHLENSHVVPAVLRKLHLARCIEQNNWQAIRKDIEKNPIDGVESSASKVQILEVLAKHGISVVSKLSKNIVEVLLWGSGNSMREFMHVDDMASASLFVLESDETKFRANTKPTLSHINIGTGIDITIFELAEILKNIIGFNGEVSFDDSKPNGAAKKLTDVSRLTNMGWNYNIKLHSGLSATYSWYIDNNK
jgi:GDP-L-fucose synthase